MSNLTDVVCIACLVAFCCPLTAGMRNLRAAATVLHIIRTSEDHCPSKSCLTLSQFAANTRQYLQPTTTLILQQGQHLLDTELVVANVDEFLIMASNSSLYKNPSIFMDEWVRFNISNATKVFMRSVVFIGYGRNQIESVNNFTLENCSFTSRKDSDYTCYQYNNGGQRKSYLGTALVLVWANAMIVNSSFISNIYGNYKGWLGMDKRSQNGSFVGGAILASHSQVTIIHSEFLENCANSGGAIFGECADITITNSRFIGNKAIWWSKKLTLSQKAFGGVLLLGMCAKHRFYWLSHHQWKCVSQKPLLPWWSVSTAQHQFKDQSQ